MSIEGMLCAAGIALLAAGMLVRTRAASVPRSAASTITEAGSPQGHGPGPREERLPAGWVGTAALWLGAALVVAAGGVVLLRLTLLSVVS